MQCFLWWKQQVEWNGGVGGSEGAEAGDAPAYTTHSSRDYANIRNYLSSLTQFNKMPSDLFEIFTALELKWLAKTTCFM